MFLIHQSQTMFAFLWAYILHIFISVAHYHWDIVPSIYDIADTTYLEPNCVVIPQHQQTLKLCSLANVSHKISLSSQKTLQQRTKLYPYFFVQNKH